MKRIILVLIGLGLCLHSRGASLTTTDGTTYSNITEQRVDPDGLYIEYSLPGGGIGMSKVKFSRLSADQQKQFGYDEAKARDYEAKVAKAEEDFRLDAIRADQTAEAQRLARQSMDSQQAQLLNDRLAALAQMQASQTEVANTGGPYWYPTFGYGYRLPRAAYILGAKNAFRSHNRDHHVQQTNPAFITTKRLANKLGL